MNYMHDYHAGNFADVVKHITLVALIECYSRKKTPFCYIDTHAGAGCYDLTAATTQKKKEYTDGIEKIIQADNPPEIIKRYLDRIHYLNNKLSKASYASLNYYPGSPMIAQSLMRGQDSVIACELDSKVYQRLKNCFADNRQVAVHHTDGYQGLKAFLPPREKRGFVLIDPPYEDINEFSSITRNLPTAIKRWQTGCFAIWYPIKEQKQLNTFYQELRKNIQQQTLIIEFNIFPEIANHLNGCGLAIINPPWQLDKTLEGALPWLWQTLKQSDQCEQKIYFL